MQAIFDEKELPTPIKLRFINEGEDVPITLKITKIVVCEKHKQTRYHYYNIHCIVQDGKFTKDFELRYELETMICYLCKM